MRSARAELSTIMVGNGMLSFGAKLEMGARWSGRERKKESNHGRARSSTLLQLVAMPMGFRVGYEVGKPYE